MGRSPLIASLKTGKPRKSNDFRVLPFQASADFARCEIGSFLTVQLYRYGLKTKSTDFPRLAKAKAAADYKGRPPSIDATKVRELKQKGLGASEIAKALKIGRASVYRALLTVP